MLQFNPTYICPWWCLTAGTASPYPVCGEFLAGGGLWGWKTAAITGQLRHVPAIYLDCVHIAPCRQIRPEKGVWIQSAWAPLILPPSGPNPATLPITALSHRLPVPFNPLPALSCAGLNCFSGFPDNYWHGGKAPIFGLVSLVLALLQTILWNSCDSTYQWNTCSSGTDTQCNWAISMWNFAWSSLRHPIFFLMRTIHWNIMVHILMLSFFFFAVKQHALLCKNTLLWNVWLLSQ